MEGGPFEGSSARADVVRNLFNVEGVVLRNSGNGCHVPNICSGNRSTLVLRETSLRAVDATFQLKQRRGT